MHEHTNIRFTLSGGRYIHLLRYRHLSYFCVAVSKSVHMEYTELRHDLPLLYLQLYSLYFWSYDKIGLNSIFHYLKTTIIRRFL